MGNKYKCHKERRTEKQTVEAELIQMEEEAERDARWAYESELLDVFYAVNGGRDAFEPELNENLPDGISLQQA